MATSVLNLHSGGQLVTLEELAEIETPPPQGRWYPVPHHKVLARVKEAMAESGYSVKREQLAVHKLNARFFGTLDVGTSLSDGVSLAVGIRSSFDKTFPLGFCAGSRVHVCSNLSFSAELMVRRKHTLNGERHFSNDIATAVQKLNSFKEAETVRIAAMKTAELTGEKADSLILNAFDKGIITTPYLPKVLKEWREPEHDEFRNRTYWSLFNAFTSALADRAKKNPHAFSVISMRLGTHLAPDNGAAFPQVAA